MITEQTPWTLTDYGIHLCSRKRQIFCLDFFDCRYSSLFMPAAAKPLKTVDSEGALSEEERHDALIEKFLSAPSVKGKELFVVKKSSLFFQKDGSTRSVLNLDCFSPNEEMKTRVICYDDKKPFHLIASLEDGSGLTISDYYQPFPGKIIIQDHTNVVRQAGLPYYSPKLVLDSTLRENGLSFLHLFVDRFLHKEGESIIVVCSECHLERCKNCSPRRTIDFKSIHVILTDKRSLQIKVPLKMEHLIPLLGISRIEILEKLSSKRDLSLLLEGVERETPRGFLLWSEAFKGRTITTISSIIPAEDGPKRTRMRWISIQT